MNSAKIPCPSEHFLVCFLLGSGADSRPLSPSNYVLSWLFPGLNIAHIVVQCLILSASVGQCALWQGLERTSTVTSESSPCWPTLPGREPTFSTESTSLSNTLALGTAASSLSLPLISGYTLPSAYPWTTASWTHHDHFKKVFIDFWLNCSMFCFIKTSSLLMRLLIIKTFLPNVVARIMNIKYPGQRTSGQDKPSLKIKVKLWKLMLNLELNRYT